MPEATQALETLLREINVERAQVMLPEDGGTPEIFAGLDRLLGGRKLDGLDRRAFYDACRLPKVRLAVSTGEKRVFANILLTVDAA